jgi:hypothetical protein
MLCLDRNMSDNILKLREFEELLNILLVRLGSNLYGENNTPDSLHLSDWSIRTVLFLFLGPLFLKSELTLDELNVLKNNGVPPEIVHDLYTPLRDFIQENQECFNDFMKCMEKYMVYFRHK